MPGIVFKIEVGLPMCYLEVQNSKVIDLGIMRKEEVSSSIIFISRDIYSETFSSD